MITKYVAADLNRYGPNKHAFLSDNQWVSDESMATLYHSFMFATNMAVEYRAWHPHPIKVQYQNSK